MMAPVLGSEWPGRAPPITMRKLDDVSRGSGEPLGARRRVNRNCFDHADAGVRFEGPHRAESRRSQQGRELLCCAFLPAHRDEHAEIGDLGIRTPSMGGATTRSMTSNFPSDPHARRHALKIASAA